jgi:hypothetical protein
VRKLDGYFPLYWDERGGQMWLGSRGSIRRFRRTDRALRRSRSNDIGLDRGSEGGGRLVLFQRVGRRSLVQPNQSFRSALMRSSAIRGRFVCEVDPLGHDGRAESGNRVLVDATPFFLCDVTGAAGSLRGGRIAST